MSIAPEYLDFFVKATEKAAYGASKFIGKGAHYPRFYPFTGSVVLRLIGRIFKISFFFEFVEKNKLFQK